MTGYIIKSLRKRLMAQQAGFCCWDYSGGHCFFRGQRMTKSSPNNPLFATLEHIKPKSEGGKHALDNVKLAHKRCNNERHHLPSYADMEKAFE